MVWHKQVVGSGVGGGRCPGAEVSSYLTNNGGGGSFNMLTNSAYAGRTGWIPASLSQKGNQPHSQNILPPSSLTWKFHVPPSLHSALIFFFFFISSLHFPALKPFTAMAPRCFRKSQSHSGIGFCLPFPPHLVLLPTHFLNLQKS